jgi:hypothetical protein
MAGSAPRSSSEERFPGQRYGRQAILVRVRALRVVLTVAGFCLGLLGGMAWHYYEFFRGPVTWIAYSAGPEVGETMQFSTDAVWWPELLLGSLGGVIVGLAAATLLGRLGWRFVRRA